MKLVPGITFLACLVASTAQAAWLGSALDTRPDTGYPGVIVRGVADGSPAARAGLKEGDVIVAAQMRPVRNAQELAQLVRAAPAGTKLSFALLRNGAPLEVTAVLANPPASSQSAQAPATLHPTAVGGGLPRGGVSMAVTQTGHCSAYVPQGWSLVSNPQASAADLVSADRRAYAGWGVRGVNQAMGGIYGSMHGAPDQVAAAMADQILQKMLGDNGGMRYTSAPQSFLGYFTLRRFETARSHGLVFYRVYPGMTQQEYVDSTYFAIADKSLGASGLMVASGVATSIRCRTQIDPQHNPGNKGGRAGCGGEGTLRGYNKELGHQFAHSRTGENFLLDHATQWQDNGPEGAGYYKQNGNFQEKLELGRSDDHC